MPSPFHRATSRALVVAAGVVFVANVTRAADAPKSSPKSGDKKASAAAAPLRVTAVTVVTAPLAEEVEATGTLRADEGVELQAEVNGKIVFLHIEEGARVAKGDLLLKLNDADLRATLQRAVWKRDLAELKERRLVRLLESSSVKQEDYDAALNELNVQRAEVALTEALIAKTEVRAPFDGVVGLRFVSEGAFVNATTRIATLQNVDRIKVDFSVPERYAGRVPANAPVRFRVPGSERVYTGKIIAIEPRIDPGTRTVSLRAVGENPDGRLVPGGFASVQVTMTEIAHAIQVPAAAVVPGLAEKNVYVVVDGKAQRRVVQTGTRSETSVLILSGLQPGEQVITSGLQQMRAGVPVVIGDAPPNAAAPGSSPAAAHTADATAAAVRPKSSE